MAHCDAAGCCGILLLPGIGTMDFAYANLMEAPTGGGGGGEREAARDVSNEGNLTVQNGEMKPHKTGARFSTLS